MTRYSSNQEVAHAWANSLNQSGRNGNGSLYFEYGAIYSYGSHFPIAVVKEGIVLFNSDNYSVTTSSHQSIVRNAIPYSYEVINIRSANDGKSSWDGKVLDNHPRNFHDWENYLIYLSGKLKKAKSKKDDYLQEIEFIKSQIQRYYNIFEKEIDKRKLSKNIKNILNNQFSTDDLKQIQESRERAEKLRKRKEELRRKEVIKRQLQDFQNHLCSSINSEKIYVRLSQDHNYIETSQRAQVPLKDALLLFDMVRKCQKSGNAITLPSGKKKIGDFDLLKIDQEGNATIGCHFIEFSEMNKLYQQVSKIININ